MFDRIIQSLSRSSNDNITSAQTRRRFPRRVSDTCVSEIAGKTFPIRDWSQCGVLIEMDSRAYHTGQKIPVTLKFKLGHAIEDIEVTAEIIRKTQNLVAFNFVNMDASAKAHFSKILDEAIAQDFINSQMA